MGRWLEWRCVLCAPQGAFLNSADCVSTTISPKSAQGQCKELDEFQVPAQGDVADASGGNGMMVREPVERLACGPCGGRKRIPCMSQARGLSKGIVVNS
jgi:hypothetical protein